MRLFFNRSFLQKSSIRNMSSLKSVSLKTVTDFLDSFAPVALAETWDNTGLLVEPITPKSIKSILLTNDLTEDVTQEAVVNQTDLIISYHPPIFKPLKKITMNTWKERIIGTCLENRIAVYSPHTSWDSVPGGVNDWLAGAFDAECVKPILEAKSESVRNAGAGRYCELKKEIKISEAIQSVKRLTGLEYLNVALGRGTTLETPIKNVAVCAGSGSSVLEKVKADLFLTGEMSHHSLLDAIHDKTSVILCNHSNSERGFLNHFANQLKNHFASFDVKIHVSQNDRDPIQVM